MSRSFRYQSSAAAELAAILDFIEQRSTIGAINWLDQYEKTIARICETPEQFPVAPESRDLSMSVQNATVRTQFGLPYRIIFIERENEIVILSVRGPGRADFGSR
jgi:hypothetical protein